MTTTKLLISTLCIFALATGAYFTFSDPSSRANTPRDSREYTESYTRSDEYRDASQDIDGDEEKDSDAQESQTEESQTSASRESTRPAGMMQDEDGAKTIITTQATSTKTTAPKVYTLEQVATHKDANSCWTIIGSNVYDVTSFIEKHPGGANKILRICGKDGSSLFENQHGGQPRPEQTLASFKIGITK